MTQFKMTRFLKIDFLINGSGAMSNDNRINQPLQTILKSTTVRNLVGLIPSNLQYDNLKSFYDLLVSRM